MSIKTYFSNLFAALRNDVAAIEAVPSRLESEVTAKFDALHAKVDAAIGKIEALPGETVDRIRTSAAESVTKVAAKIAPKK